MSKRGDKENNCLNVIKKSIFEKNGEKIINPFTKKNYEQVSDKDFENEQILYTNSDSYKNFFGLLEEDRKEIEQILRLAKPNDNLNNFPDLVFKNGFIEHFQVSSSKETRRGAEHLKEMNNFEKKVENNISRLQEEWSENPSYEEVRDEHWETSNPEHSHGYLIKSFQKHWESHIESLHKYEGKKEIGIFLVEYTDFALAMYEEVYKDWINGMSQGDMRKPESFSWYRLSRDKKLLNYLYEYRNEIKYVIFVYFNGYEIIRLDKIPYLLKLLPFEYNIHSMYVNTVSSLYNISKKIDLANKQ